MSKFGYINNSYGKQFNIGVANTYSYNLLNGSNLPQNSLIISSNIDDNGNDTGTYSLIATDYEGKPIRLTYTISEGNGLYYSSDEDAISLHIDNKIIISDENGLTLNLGYVLSNDFVINGNNIYLNVGNIPNASSTNLGIAAVDNKTIKIEDGKIYVSTQNLQYANNESLTYGIAIGDNNTIITDKGHIKLNVNSLNKADIDKYGLVISDNNTVLINDGIISVNTKNLDKTTLSNYGIAKQDNSTIILNGKNEVTVNENNLNVASSYLYGISKIDSVTLNLNDNIISMKDYADINSYISLYKKSLGEYENKINEFIEYVSSGNILFKSKDIQLFAVNETSVGELVKPIDNEEVINMPEQTISAVFDIITTCDFILSIIFEEGTNIFPNVDILEVNYNDEFIYDKETALHPDTTYPSTNGEKKKLIVKFIAKNYKNSVRTEYVITSVNFTIANSEDHLKYKTEKYSIVRYNSLFNKLTELEKEETSEARYVLRAQTVYWR